MLKVSGCLAHSVKTAESVDEKSHVERTSPSGLGLELPLDGGLDLLNGEEQMIETGVLDEKG